MKVLIATILLFSYPVLTSAQSSANSSLSPGINQYLQKGTMPSLIENKGQMVDMEGKPLEDLLFKTQANGVDFYITTSGISYVFIKQKKKTKTEEGKFHRYTEGDVTEFEYCRADMELIGADIQKENIVKESENIDYSNYFSGYSPNGILNVHSYKKISIKNVYPGIDWVLYINEKQELKYDFIINPGANPSAIKLSYKWTDGPQLQTDGSLKINVPLGTIYEGVPISYSIDVQKKKVPTSYSLQNGEITFNVADYNKTKPLVIDPTLVWATFYGGSLVETGNCISSDSTNVWVTGSVRSSDFPTLNPSTGAYFQGTMAGSDDAFILKFNKKDVLLWATYYGGSASDEAYSVNSDGTNVWVTGMTRSTNFPTLNPGSGAYYQNSLSGNQNCFLLQFTTNGNLKWATYYGGNGYDVGQGISSDGTNVWVTGTTSSTNFPVLNPGGGAYFQPANGGGTNDAFILQFNTSGISKWATYYGGSADDESFSINSDGTNVWLTGSTASSNFPTYNPGGGAYYQNALAGTVNAFILQFNTLGISKWATYYGGNGSDYGYSINSDGKNAWVTGATTSRNLPVVSAGKSSYYQDTSGGNNDIFLLKFTPAGVCKWATYYGGYSDDYGYSINSDGRNVWVTGYTWTQNIADYSPWIYLLNPGGGAFYEDPFVTTNNVGGDNAVIMEFDTSGTCKWATFYGTEGGAYGSSIQSDGANVWLTGSIWHLDDLPVVNPGGGAYYQDTIDGGAGHQDTYTVLLAQFTACNVNDVIIEPALASICAGDSIKLNAIGGTTYAWTPATGLSSTNVYDPIAAPTTTTTYSLNYSAGKCKGTETAKIVVYPKLIPSISAPSDVCIGSSVSLDASGGLYYKWSPATSLNDDSIANPIGTPTTTTTYTVTIANQACFVKDSVTIKVKPVPVVTACCNTTINGGESVTFGATAIPGSGTYNWSPSSGLNCTSCPNPTASPDETTTYTVTYTDSLGCNAEANVIIDVNCSLFVPDAFSPNGDGNNDYLYVRDNCIKTMTFIIYDRWGNKIFESNDPAIPWDGTCKGQPMNTGTYTYYLSATTFSGKILTKKGNVALVR